MTPSKETLGSTYVSDKLYQIYELRDRLLKRKCLHGNAQSCCLGSNDRSKNLEKTRSGSWIIFDITAQTDCTSIITKCEYYRKRYIWIKINCKNGGRIKRKSNTRCNSTKGEQVRKVVMWHWCIVMSERNSWFMLHFKNFWSHCSSKLHRTNPHQ